MNKNDWIVDFVCSGGLRDERGDEPRQPGPAVRGLDPLGVSGWRNAGLPAWFTTFATRALHVAGAWAPGASQSIAGTLAATCCYRDNHQSHMLAQRLQTPRLLHATAFCSALARRYNMCQSCIQSVSLSFIYNLRRPSKSVCAQPDHSSMFLISV